MLNIFSTKSCLHRTSCVNTKLLTILTTIQLSDYFSEHVGLVEYGVFDLNISLSMLPILKLSRDIQWPQGKVPLAMPPCGFMVTFLIQISTDKKG